MQTIPTSPPQQPIWTRQLLNLVPVLSAVLTVRCAPSSWDWHFLTWEASPRGLWYSVVSSLELLLAGYKPTATNGKVQWLSNNPMLGLVFLTKLSCDKNWELKCGYKRCALTGRQPACKQWRLMPWLLTYWSRRTIEGSSLPTYSGMSPVANSMNSLGIWRVHWALLRAVSKVSRWVRRERTWE